MTFADLISTLDSIIWALPLVVLCLVAGLYFSIRTGFVQLRGLPDMIRQLVKGEKSADGTSSFQSLMMSLANRVGMGNIGGVATAIAFGGPGAVFWMWVVALLGAATSFIESTLGQIYKEKDPDTGEYRGGPAYYFEKAYKHKAKTLSVVYAVLFAAVTVLAMSFFLPGVQANGMSSAIEGAWGVPTWATAIGIVIVLAFIVVGGVKRIASFAALIVPPMAIIYILAALAVFFVNFDQIPHVFGEIFSGAFGTHAVYGAIIGLAIKWGVQRGIYSNEAGQGTGPHHAAAAEVSHPAKQGFVQAFSVYIDTLFVCTATAFIIISTDMYSVFQNEDFEAGETLYVGAIGTDVEPGPGFVQNGFDDFAPGLGAGFVALALTFFAFTTMVAYYYMAEVNLAYLTRRLKSRLLRRGLIRALQALILVSVAYGAITTAGSAWSLGDIGVGSMAWLNIVGILFLQVPALKALKDYYRQKRAGKDPQFDPREIGIENAEFWEQRADGRVHQGEPGEQVGSEPDKG